MHEGLDRELSAGLDALAARGLRREVVLDGRARGVDFGSNDYLGLSRDPVIGEAMVRAVRDFGVGGRSARLLNGGSPLHEQCEAAVAAWLGAEAALLFPSGYQANVGLIGALAGRGDAVISDRDNHASLIDGVRLSRAQVFVHAHADLEDLERVLRASRGARRRIVLTEGVFSMSGNAAPLAAIDALCRRYDAWLVVDEAHSIGLLGSGGAGAWVAAAAAADFDGRGNRICARIVTGGKALGVGGALVVGSSVLREQMIHAARSFLFSTAPPPALAGGLLAAIARCQEVDQKRALVLGHARRLANVLELPEPPAAIVPVPIGGSEDAVSLAKQLEDAGYYVPAVRPPTVAPGHARLRAVCHADHTDEQVASVARLIQSRRAELANSHPGNTSAAQDVVRSVTCVVGTDTGVGKTVVSALLLRAALRAGKAQYWKPVQTGDDDDTATVAALAGADPEALLPNHAHYALPASPHQAASAEGDRVHLEELRAAMAGHRADPGNGHLLVELAGGLLVPFDLDPPTTQADWLAVMQARIVLVARSGLGTLNHTMLTVAALRQRHLQPAALFLVGDVHDSNRETLRQMADVPHIYELPTLDPLSGEALDGWLDGHDLEAFFRD